MTEPSKIIGFVFIDRFADWEFGLLAASAVEWFGARAVSLAPGGAPGNVDERIPPGSRPQPRHCGECRSGCRGGDRVGPVGTRRCADISSLLTSVAARNGVVGRICAGTLALARAGLFAAVRHASNDRAWLLEKQPGYAGAAHYQDVPHAVADKAIVSAPGSASGTFAHQFLLALFPSQEARLSEMRSMFGKEYGSRQSS